MITYGQLLGNGFRDEIAAIEQELTSAEKELTSSINKTMNPVETITNKINIPIPMNLYEEENGSYTFELAIPGKTKENVKLSSINEQGKIYLVFDVNANELTEEEKAAKEKRIIKVQKISGMTKLYYKYAIPSKLDVSKLTAKVQNGLLTVNVPVKEESKPIEFEIE